MPVKETAGLSFETIDGLKGVEHLDKLGDKLTLCCWSKPKRDLEPGNVGCHSEQVVDIYC